MQKSRKSWRRTKTLRRRRKKGNGRKKGRPKEDRRIQNGSGKILGPRYQRLEGQEIRRAAFHVFKSAGGITGNQSGRGAPASKNREHPGEGGKDEELGNKVSWQGARRENEKGNAPRSKGQQNYY